MLDRLKSTKNILVISFAILMMMACKKNEKNDTLKPVITIAEPLSNDTLSIAMDPEIHIEFTTSDESGLHALYVTLIKNNTDTLLNQNPDVMGLKVYAFHEHVVATGITSLTPLTAIIRAEDHSNNVELKTINFVVNP